MCIAISESYVMDVCFEFISAVLLQIEIPFKTQTLKLDVRYMIKKYEV